MCAASLAWKIFVKYASLNHYLKTCLEPSLEAFQQLMPLVNIHSHANITISRLLHIISHGFFCLPCEKQNNTLKILNENAVCCLLLTCLSLFTACYLYVCVFVCVKKGKICGKNLNSVLSGFLQRQTRQR